MGVTYIEGVVPGPTGGQAAVPFLLDSGATCTLLPSDDWRGIELEPKRSVTFTLAEGTTIEPKVSDTRSLQPMRMLLV